MKKKWDESELSNEYTAPPTVRNINNMDECSSFTRISNFFSLISYLLYSVFFLPKLFSVHYSVSYARCECSIVHCRINDNRTIQHHQTESSSAMFGCYSARSCVCSEYVSAYCCENCESNVFVFLSVALHHADRLRPRVIFYLLILYLQGGHDRFIA